MDRGFAEAWSAVGQLHSHGSAAGVAGSDTVSQLAGRRSGACCEPAAESAGRREHQAGECGDRRHRCVRRAILEALLAGQTDPQVLAELALRKKIDLLQKALSGRLKPHHRVMVTELLGQIDHLDETIERLNAEITEQMRPFEAEIERLDSIPGVSRRVAEVLVAEVGVDMQPFERAENLASWAGMCPGNNESAGKRKSGKTRKGSRWLRAALTEAAHGAARSKHTYLKAQYHRIARRRGAKRALVAVGHSILIIAYHLLTRQQTYRDLGENYFDERDHEGVKRRAVRRLEQLGYQVTLAPLMAVAA